MALSVSDAFWDISGTQAARGSYVINLGYELAACFRVFTMSLENALEYIKDIPNVVLFMVFVVLFVVLNLVLSLIRLFPTLHDYYQPE